MHSLLVFGLCFELHVVMMRSMSNVFLVHQLLHWQTTEQCLLVDADVRKVEGISHANKIG